MEWARNTRWLYHHGVSLIQTKWFHQRREQGRMIMPQDADMECYFKLPISRIMKVTLTAPVGSLKWSILYSDAESISYPRG
ncbi:hypothetical protein WG66_005992 [Moniliophthora roreri]|nr:hypothetical protein WG66_005992 [Moniliophthora roreri]